MMRAAGVVAVALGLWALPQEPQQPPVFRAAASAVMVDVSVRDGSRRVINDLTSADFTILDNGVAQQVDQISYGKLPIDVTVGLDISGSVNGPMLERLRNAVHQLMRELRKEDRLKLMVFNMRFSQTIDFTTDLNQIDQAIRNAGGAGGTALYDALSVALITAADPARRQLVVFFTDGNDTSSTTSAATLVKVAERSRATVSVVLVPTISTIQQRPVGYSTANTNLSPALLPGSGSEVFFLDTALNRITMDTGGQISRVNVMGSMGIAFVQLLDRFRSAYVLYYSPRGVDRAGFHMLSVTVNRPGAVVEARRGYFGG